MPLVRIEFPSGSSEQYRAQVGNVVYQAMLQTLNVPMDDRFFVLTEHGKTDLIISPTYLGIQRSEKALLIQITLNEGRTVEMKKAFYKAVADGLHQQVGVRKEDVFIGLVEVKKENWSFGNGEAQYA
jgi:phenylpyruvate tautomerase PptA (4-oxalocrotonate tautomerase family)